MNKIQIKIFLVLTILGIGALAIFLNYAPNYILKDIKIKKKINGENLTAGDTTNLFQFDQLKHYIDEQTKKLKIFIPNLKHDENNRILNGIMNHGHGKLVTYFKNSSIGIFYTDQFAIDLMFYDRLKNDHSVLVDNLKDANTVYIPLMIGYICATNIGSIHGTKGTRYYDVVHAMALWLKENEEALVGKKVVLVYSRVEGSLLYDCKIRTDTRELLNKYANDFHLLSIEKYRLVYRAFNFTSSVIPYPSTTKFMLKRYIKKYEYDLDDDRPVDIFFTGNWRNNTAYRKYVIEHINLKVNNSYSASKDQIIKVNGHVSVSYSIGGIYTNKSVYDTMEWKLKSKVCLEPYGDTPTRRSFWDSIMLGCIPVIFTHIPMPFKTHIDYTRFVIQLNLPQDKLYTTNLYSLLDIYLKNTDWMSNARKYIKQIRQFLQYTWLYNEKSELIDPTFKYDAYGMTLSSLADYV